MSPQPGRDTELRGLIASDCGNAARPLEVAARHLGDALARARQLDDQDTADELAGALDRLSEVVHRLRAVTKDALDAWRAATKPYQDPGD